MPESDHSVTMLLERMQAGDNAAAAQLMPLIYEELRALASRYFHREDAQHTLQPTALVHEAYLRLVRNEDARWENRGQFLAVAARVMRNVLINHARDRRAQKRGGGLQRITLSDMAAPADSDIVDLLALDEAMQSLEGLNERHARIVELRVFSGLTLQETASVMGISESTVSADWTVAKAWLKSRLSGPTTR